MYKEILAAVDLDDREMSRHLIDEAAGLAEAFGARLHVMIVVPGFGMALVGQQFPRDFEKKALQQADAALHAFTKEALPEGVEVQHIVAHGTIYREIIETAEKIDADLIVVGAHRPDLKDYLLGPNAARVMRHSARSVLVVRK